MSPRDPATIVSMLPGLRRRLRTAFLAAAAAAFLLAPLARAEEGEGEEGAEPAAEDLESKIKAQMEKIVRLMRENEAALLEASRAGGKAPAGVDVEPPETPPAGEGAPPSGEAPPPERGQEIRRRMDELIRGATERGRSIPKELEELVKMIPLQGGSSQGEPKSEEEQREAEARRRQEAGKPESAEESSTKPRDGDPRPEERGTDRPPEAGTDTPPRNDVPPWIQELPPEVRRKVLAQDFSDVPERYRDVVKRYLKWLQDRAGTPSR